MLKIKDSIDLKELEKSKFEYEEWPYDNIGIDKIYVTQGTIINCENRSIDMGNSEEQFKSELFDLIQAGLVKKVVD